MGIGEPVAKDWSWLSAYDAALPALIEGAIRYSASDPPAALAKIRIAGEKLAAYLARNKNLRRRPNESADEFIDRLVQADALPANLGAKLHTVRRLGNSAVHENIGSASDVSSALQSFVVIAASLDAPQQRKATSAKGSNKPESIVPAKEFLRGPGANLARRVRNGKTVAPGSASGDRYRGRKTSVPWPTRSRKGLVYGVCAAVAVFLVVVVIWRSQSEAEDVRFRKYNQFSNEGNIAYNAERFDDAAILYGKAIARRPQESIARIHRADSYFASGQYEEASEDYSSALTLGGGGPDVSFRLAESLRLSGSPDGALPHYARAVEQNAGLCIALVGSGFSFLELDRWDEAEAMATRSLNCDTNLEQSLLIRGAARYSLGRYGLALEDYLQYAGIHPESEDIHERLANTYARLGDVNQQTYERRVASNIRWNNIRGVGTFFHWLLN